MIVGGVDFGETDYESTSSEYIGKVIFSRKEPSKPLEFKVWFKDSPDLEIEVGSMLVAEDPESGEKIIGMVSELEYKSTSEDFMTEFFSSGFGRPETKPLTERTIVRLGTVRVIAKEPSRKAPPERRLLVRKAVPEDIELMISKRIPKKSRILAGFMKIGREDQENGWMPLFYHSDLIMGPEGAHVNIYGLTGLASKTSYALFLVYSLLAWAKSNGQSVAVILFNVKRKDFLLLHKIPRSWEELEKWIEEWSQNQGMENLKQRTIALWKAARKWGVNPIDLKPEVKYFTYDDDPWQNLMENPFIYSYGLMDLEREDLIAALFRPGEESVAVQQVNLIDDYFFVTRRKDKGKIFPESFKGFLDRLKKHSTGEGSRTNLGILTAMYARSTVQALVARLSGFLSRATHVVNKEMPNANPIKFEQLIPGLNVVQLYQLSDSEKRLVVNAVIREVRRGMEEAQRSHGGRIGRVVIVMDELNLYAPKKASPIKEQVIDVVARGRDLLVSLIGIEQFASKVDSEVYGNSGTKVVGAISGEEARADVSKFLGEMKDIAISLEKGQMIVSHPAYGSTPLMIWFPVPFNRMLPEEDSEEKAPEGSP